MLWQSHWCWHQLKTPVLLLTLLPWNSDPGGTAAHKDSRPDVLQPILSQSTILGKCNKCLTLLCMLLLVLLVMVNASFMENKELSCLQKETKHHCMSILGCWASFSVQLFSAYSLAPTQLRTHSPAARSWQKRQLEQTLPPLVLVPVRLQLQHRKHEVRNLIIEMPAASRKQQQP